MANLVVHLLGETKHFDAKLAESQHKLAAFGQKASGVGSAIKTGLGVAAVGGVLLLAKESLHLGEAFDQAHVKLETAVKNVGQNFEEFKGKIDGTTDKMANLGFNAIDTENSLAKLTIATHDVGKATELMALAADLARFKHVSLTDATADLVKIEAGRFRGLASLGIKTSDLKGRTDAVAVAIGRLSAAVKGQAQAAADTLGGRFEVLKAKAENFGVTIGQRLIPLIEGLFNAVATAADWFQTINAATDGWAGKLAVLAGGLLLTSITIGKLTSLASAIPLLGGAFGALLPPVLAVTAAVFGLRAIVGAFAPDASDSAAATDELAKGLTRLGASGSTFGVVAERLGDHMQKLAKSFRAVSRDEGRGLLNWADNTISGFLGVASASDDIKAPIENTQKALLSLYKTDPKDAVSAFEKIKAGLVEQGISAEEVDKRFKKFKETAGALSEVLKPVTKEQVAQAQASADAAKKIKEHAKALEELGATAGVQTVTIAKALHLSDDAIKSLTENIKDINKTAEGSFDSVGNVISEFSDKAVVNFDEVVKAEYKQLVATQNWASNMNRLADAGLNQGLLKKLEAAGPKSAGLVQSIVDHIKDGSIKTFNDMNAAEQAALADHKKHLDGAVIEAQTHIGQITAYIKSIPPKWQTDIVVTANLTNTIDQLNSLRDVYLQLGQYNLADRLSRQIENARTSLPNARQGGARGPHAAGGVIGPGEWGTVGEAGWELAQGLPGGGARIYPHGQSRNMARIGGGGGRVMNVNLTVNALDPQTAGAVVVRALKAYQQTDGPIDIKTRG